MFGNTAMVDLMFFCVFWKTAVFYIFEVAQRA